MEDGGSECPPLLACGTVARVSISFGGVRCLCAACHESKTARLRAKREGKILLFSLDGASSPPPLFATKQAIENGGPVSHSLICCLASVWRLKTTSADLQRLDCCHLHVLETL